MAAPPKPWERAMMNRSAMNSAYANALWSQDNCKDGHNCSSQGSNPFPIGGSSNVRSPLDAPPLPPRPDRNLTSQTAYSSRYGGYGYAAASPYSSFSHYSPYLSNYNYGSRLGGGGYGGMENYGPSDNNFVRLAEESSRQAFSSIESIVQAFASVSMMLESTYHAVYSSFRAVLGVADHFSRLRVQLAQILSTLALVRTLQWFCRKVMYMLGLVKDNPATEAAWSQAAKVSADCLDEGDVKRSRSSWPIMMFFGVVFGAPWLIWKLLSAVAQSEYTEKWMTREGAHYVGITLYNFQGDTEKELSFVAGQQITLAPKALQPRVRGWLRATVDGKKIGLVPANYVKIQGFRKGVKHPQEANAPIEPEHLEEGEHVTAPPSPDESMSPESEATP